MTNVPPMDDLLRRYVDGRLDVATSVRVELAMGQSLDLRDQVGALIPDDRLAANFAALTAELDAPRPRAVERLLARVGMRTAVARLLVATPSLRRSWFIAVGVALLFALAAVDPDRPEGGLLFLLAVAPLIPVLGVALAYGPGVDPAYEVTVATPISGLRLVLLRSVSVLAVSIPLAGLATLLVPDPDPIAAAWLLPAFSLSAVCLALMTWVRPRHAAGWVSGIWLLAIIVLSNRTDDRLLAFRPAGQAVIVALGLAAAVVVYLRRERFETASAGVAA